MSKAHAAIETHRATLIRLAERQATSLVHATFDEARADVARNLASTVGASAGQNVNPTLLASLRLRLHYEHQSVARAMAGEMDRITRDAFAEGARIAARTAAAFHGGPTPLDDARWVARIQSRHMRDASLVQRRYLNSWASDASRRANDAIGTALVEGGTFGDALARADRTLADGWTSAERVVRTEAAHAYNVVQDEAVRELARAWPDTLKRWVERVSDTTGAPLDKRVAADSIAMHGQVVPPDGEFEMPHDLNVDSTMWGRRWAFPPNRPNDRAVVMPWRPAWKVPAWALRNGQRVTLQG